MKLEITNESPAEIDADAVIVGVYQSDDEQPSIDGVVAELDSVCEGALSRLAESGELSAAPMEITTLLAPTGVKTQRIVLVGMGLPGEPAHDLSFRAAAAGIKSVAGRARSRVAIYLTLDRPEFGVSGSIVACVGQDLFRSERSIHPVETISWFGITEDQLGHGRILGESTNLTRRLVNLPANEIYPASFADEIVTTGGQAGFEVEIWDEKKLEAENCGAMLAVGRASGFPPRLVIMRYNGGADDQAPLGLVGKGVTFDSGGLSLKPGASMLDMKCDMAGAATVVGAMAAIARLKLPVNVFGFVGLAENMVSGNSYRLGDVLKTRNGKTVEVHNTDAEGRLVLADTLDVAVESGVDRLIDLATLTGACVVALGLDVVGLMTNEDSWAEHVQQAAQDCGEYVWPLPMFPEFAKQIKSKVADIKNVGEGRWGGAITAGKFLEEFVRGTPWVHLDIAGPSFANKESGWIDAGASGCMVRTLVEVATGHGDV